MSEYRFVHFLALDRPLDEAAMEFMRNQSTRAKITRWEFTNEYHFGDFRGDDLIMLQRGYDVHLHFANYGIRKLVIRIPGGLPCAPNLFERFCPDHGVTWHPDTTGSDDTGGSGGSLEISPEGDGSSWDGYIDGLSDLLPAIASARELLMQGDLRPLYIAWLACTYGDILEPPVPAGMKSLPKALLEMARFYEIDSSLLEAAAERSPDDAPPGADQKCRIRDWLNSRSGDEARDLAFRLMTEDAAGIRTDVLAKIREQAGPVDWPVAEPSRTLAVLYEEAESLAARKIELARAEAARRHAERIAQLAADPKKAIAHVKSLVARRSTTDYELAAKELADLRDALDSAAGRRQVANAVASLLREYPALNRLKSSLRKYGLIPKR